MALKLQTPMDDKKGGNPEYASIINYMDYSNHLIASVLVWKNERAKKDEGLDAMIGVTFEWADGNPGLPDYPLDHSSNENIKTQIYKAIKQYPAWIEQHATQRAKKYNDKENFDKHKADVERQLHAKFSNFTKSKLIDA